MLGAIAVAFTSCNDDDNGPTSQAITLSHTAVPTGAEEVRNIAVFAWNDDPHVVVYSTLTANGFTLLLDRTPHPDALHTIPAGARIAEEVTIEGFSTNDGTFNEDDLLGEFWNERTVSTETTLSMTTEFYWYTDRDLTLIDDTDEEFTLDLTLRQGWNRVFITVNIDFETFDITMGATTTTVTGLTWVFDPIDAPNVPAAAPANVTAEDVLRNKVREVRSRGAANILQDIR